MAAILPSRFLFLGLVVGALTTGCAKDEDGDGYKVGDGDFSDCDDNDADVYPGADEYCDGVDNNCNGVVDEVDALDVSTWYGDGDGDGFGLGSATEVACDQPNGYVSLSGDCDDANAALNPDTYWYADADGDTYGDPDEAQQSCIAPDGYVSDFTDCDDTADDVNPGEEELCDEVDHDCDDHSGMFDEDGDGYAACEGDCDDVLDDDPEAGPYADEIYPGADEVCDEYDNDCDEEIDEDDAVDAPTWYLDYDQDGYGGDSYTWVQCEPEDGTVDNADDCDDLRADIYPGADEYCDGDDNDCDKEVDETPAVDAPTWYVDNDGDGYGTKDDMVTDECEMPSGYAETADDCDDDDYDTNPGASEYCDGHDDDCDGDVDESDAVDVAPWYLDEDGDGYGQSAEVTFSCSEPSGFTASSGDCNDEDSTINPDADEVCDGDDNDCDGVADEDDAVDADLWYADSDGDGYGDAGSTQNACNQPTDAVADATDCDDADADVNPDADEVCNDGIDNDCDGGYDGCVLDAADADLVFLGNAASDQGAKYISCVGDWNADGYDEVLISSRSAEGTAGVNYLYYGPFTADGSVTTMAYNADGGADATFYGEAAGDLAAVTTAGMFDPTGDGVVDIAIGSASPDTERGTVWLIFGDHTTPPSGDISLADADATFNGENAYDRIGAPGGLAYVGDIDNDGNDDMVLGAHSADYNGSLSGTAYFVYGPVTAGDHEVSDLDDFVYGGDAAYHIGKIVDYVGDTNGDGVNDVMLGSIYMDSYTGGFFMFTTAPSGAVNSDDADAYVAGESTGDYATFSVSGAGDQNDDGYDDVLIGATRDDLGASDGGAAYLMIGEVADGDMGSDYYAKFYGTNSAGNLGSDVDGVEDYDGAGTPAVMAGATSEVSAAGRTYLWIGAVSGAVSADDADAVFEGTTSGDALGDELMFSSDIDGTGIPWILLGTYQADEGGTDAGAAYFIESIGQ